jgi:hypothetical protein
MNTMLFWNPKTKKVVKFKVVQTKLGIWRNARAMTVAHIHKIAKRDGLVHFTTRTKLREVC